MIRSLLIQCPADRYFRIVVNSSQYKRIKCLTLSLRATEGSVAISPPPYPPPSRGRERVGGLLRRYVPRNDKLLIAFVLVSLIQKNNSIP
jgi:hypothetical protein